MTIRERIDRKNFLRRFAFLLVGAGVFFRKALSPGLLAKTKMSACRVPRKHELNGGVFVVKGGEPAVMAREVIKLLGGMEKLVKSGDAVVVKPNIGWNKLPENAANTNPELVAEIVKMCYGAGAKTVSVFDRTCDEAFGAYNASGIKKAAKLAGAKVKYFDPVRVKDVFYEKGLVLKSWPVCEEILSANVIINVPVGKHHGMAKLSLSLKNMMGVIGWDRGEIHQDFARKITDINMMIKPELTIIDCYRILKNHGPQGGNLEDVELKKILIASTDSVAADAYAATVFGLKPSELEYLGVAASAGLGEQDLSKVKVNVKNV